MQKPIRIQTCIKNRLGLPTATFRHVIIVKYRGLFLFVKFAVETRVVSCPGATNAYLPDLPG